MKKLMSMTSFMDEAAKIYVPRYNEKLLNEFHKNFFDKTMNYKEFLDLPLHLGMFFPVGQYGNVLDMPKNYYEWLSLYNEEHINMYGESPELEYKVACEKVVFIGVNEMQVSIILSSYSKIEHLLFLEIDFTLSTSALKQLGVDL